MPGEGKEYNTYALRYNFFVYYAIVDMVGEIVAWGERERKKERESVCVRIDM